MKSKLQIQNFRVVLFSLLMIMVSFAVYAQPCTANQSTADFYTKASGEFSNPAIWEYQNSCGDWIEATQPPGPNNTCVIRSLDHSDVFIPQQINSLVIQTGGSLTITNELTVGAGSSGGSSPIISVSGLVTIPVTGYLTDDTGVPIDILSTGSIESIGEIHLSGDMMINGHFSGIGGNHGKLYLTGGFTQTITANSDNNNLGDVFVDKTLGISLVRIHNNSLLTTLDIPLLQMAKGTVKFFNETKGFGFIKVEEGSESKIVAGTADLFVRGDMSIHGQYDGALGKLTFDGASPQVFDHSPDPASPPSNFGELVFSNIAGGITVIGNTIPVFAREAKTHSISEVVVTKAMKISGPVLINQGTQFTFTATAELSVGGDMTVQGQYNGVDGKLTFDGASAQVFDHSPDPASPPSNFGELVFSNTAGGITVIGNTIPVFAREAKTHSISEVVVTKAMKISGPVLINQGTQFTFTATAELSVGGDMTVHGQYNGVDGKLTLNGTTPQVITYDPPVSSPQSNFGDVSFNNTSASGVQITGSPLAIWLSKRGYDYYKASSDIAMSFQESFTIGSGATMEVIGTTAISVGGDWINNGGTFIPGAGTVIFNGSGNSIIGGTASTQYFNNLTVNKSVGTSTNIWSFPVCHARTITIQSGILDAGSATDIFVSGDWINNGSFIPGNSTVVFEGTTINTIGGTTHINDFNNVKFRKLTAGTVLIFPPIAKSRVHNLEIESGFLEVVSGSEIEVSGDWTNNGGTFIPGDGAVIFNGSGNSIIGGTSSSQDFNNLTINKSDGTSSAIYECLICHCRTITIQSGILDAGSATAIFVSGDWINNGGAFDPGTSSVEFNGSALQTIGGVVPATFHDVTINNSYSLVEVMVAAGISGGLSLAVGKLILNDNDLFIESPATITGASPTSYIVTNGKGSLKRQLITIVGGPNTQIVYPIGTETGYSPVTYQLFSTTGQPVVLGARVADGVSTAYDTDDNPIGNAVVPRSVIKSFFAKGSIPSGDYIKMKLQWNGADEGVGFDRSSCNLGHYTGGQWVYSDAIAAVAVEPSGSYSATFDTAVTSLSPFAVFSQSITNSFTGTTFCAGQTVPITYSATGGEWNAGNIFKAELSDVAGNFPGTIIGSLSSTALTGTIDVTIPTTTTSGSNYRIRINSTISKSKGVENDANLTINNETITTQPAAPFICNVLGATTSISVATSTLNPGYVWQSRIVNATNPNPAWTNMINNANYSGVNTAMLTITKSSSSFATGIQYRVLVTGACGVLTSNSVALTVISTVKAGTISAPASVCLGGDITFTLTKYAGTSVQWQSALSNSTTSPGVFADILGATSDVLTITGATAGMNKSYRAIVTSNCGANAPVITAVKTIKVDPLTVPGTISGGGVVCSSGGSGTLKLTGYVGSIQWEYSTDGGSWTAAPNASAGQTTPFTTTSASSIAATYLVANIAQNLSFRARVTSGACSLVYATPVQFTVGGTAVVGSVQGVATAAICKGTGTTLSLTGTNVGVVSWQKRLVTATLWTTIANSTNVSSIDTGNLTSSTVYRAVATIGSCSTVNSSEVTVAIVAPPLSKTVKSNATSPSGATQTVALCTSFNIDKTLTVGAGSNGTIKWQRSITSATALDFVDIPGATGTSYTINQASVGQNWYRAVFTNSCGASVNGTAVTLWYNDCTPAKMVSANANVQSFDIKAYPNSYSESFSLYLTTSSQERVGIKVYDMTGKLVDSREVAAHDMATLHLGNNYQSGVYNVIVTQGTEVKTLRVIKR